MSTRVRVLHVQDKCGHGTSRIQGVQRLLEWWADAFRNAPFDFEICILREPKDSDDWQPGDTRVHRLGRSRFDVRTIFDLRHLITREGFDVLHCHGYGATTFGRIAGALSGTPVLVHEHMIDEHIPWYQRVADGILAPLTSRGIAVSEAVADFLVQVRRLPPERVEIVYNATPDYAFDAVPEETRRALLRELGLNPAAPRIAIFGRLHPVKGHEDFLRAAALVHVRVPDAEFLVVGDGPLADSLPDLAATLGIGERVRFLGLRDDVRELLSISDVSVVASHSEGFSLVAVEALAQAKPVVATRVGGIPEVVRDGETGILVPAQAPMELARAIEQLIGDKALASRLGARGLEDAKQRFSMAGSEQAFTRIYNSVVRAAPTNGSTYQTL